MKIKNKIVKWLLAAVVGFSLTHAADVNFLHDYDEAVALAQKENKPLMVVFSATWCPPCQTMKKEVYPSTVVKRELDDWVCVYLDFDDSKNKKVKTQYQVKNIPHIQLLSSKEVAIDKQVGSSTAQQFAKWLKKNKSKAAK
jgi:thiol:disulfide interchange protein